MKQFEFKGTMVVFYCELYVSAKMHSQFSNLPTPCKHDIGKRIQQLHPLLGFRHSSHIPDSTFNSDS
ncbi:hypothetical protein ACLKA6_020038 [Drosophila palustris]